MSASHSSRPAEGPISTLQHRVPFYETDGMGYELRCGGEALATAVTEHAMVDRTGRPARILMERRANLQKIARAGG